jgi:hypothetical protein
LPINTLVRLKPWRCVKAKEDGVSLLMKYSIGVGGGGLPIHEEVGGGELIVTNQAVLVEIVKSLGHLFQYGRHGTLL